MRRTPLALAFLAAAAAAQDPAPLPNIVVLFADDAGYADFGFQPDADAALARRTPQIDRIAREGVRFSDAYVSGCVCSPSRAGLLTGRYQQRFGHEQNIPPGYMQGGLPLEERTMADRLAALDYATGLVGKWHLGYPDEYHPNRRGFAWFHGLLQGSRSYFPIRDVRPHRAIQQDGEPLPEVGYVTDRFGAAAVRYIEEHRERPFFLFVSFTAPHGPLEALDADLGELADIEAPRRRKYAGLVVALDRAVGRVLDALDRCELSERTLVVFTNDNGGQTQTGADNAPLRGRKGQLWEGGIRVPMAMRWPGQLRAGSVVGDPVITLDFVPTFVGLAGGAVAADELLDGVDLMPRLRGTVDSLPERPLFWRSAGSGGDVAMRRGPFKLVVERAGGQETVHLFDLRSDLGEAVDLAERETARVAALRGELARWEAQLVEPLWGPGSGGD